jgi:hypothetical protein
MSPTSDHPNDLPDAIDLLLIRKALAEAQGEPTREERARAFVASLSALLLMAGDLELGNGIGALIGLRQIDAEALARLIEG